MQITIQQKKIISICCTLILFCLPALAASAEPVPLIRVTSVPVYSYKIINMYPHDTYAFTQGLVFENGFLYEGTGLTGQSILRKIRLKDGLTEKEAALPADLFGEGITVFRDKIIQLTWRSHIGFVYDKKSFRLLKTFMYPTEGWGLTHDGTHMIMSDGTQNLYFLDPATFKEKRRMSVSDKGVPVARLNELEYIHGEIYANVWLTDLIVIIDPRTGRVTGWIDLAGLLPDKADDRTEKTLNGIAYDAKNDRLFVTGKLWPYLYEIRLVPEK